MSFLSRILIHLRSPYGALTGYIWTNSWKVVSSSKSAFFYPFKGTSRFCSNNSTSGSSSSLVTANRDDLAQNDSIQAVEIIEDESLLPSQRKKQHSNLLMVEIYACNSAVEALNLLTQHREVMDSHHILAIMNRLQVLVENGLETVEKINSLEEFSSFCHKLWKTSRRMEIDEQLSLLKFLCRMRILSDSKIMQTVLQLLRHSINDLDLRQLIYLDFLLKKLPPTPLSDGLLVAVPVVIDNILKNEILEELSAKDLSQLLAICIDGRINNIGIILQEVYRQGTIISASLGLSILWSLVMMFVTEGKRIVLSKEESLVREVLMKECLESISKDLKSLTRQKIETTLEKLCEAHRKKDRCTYNEHFLNAVAKHAVDDQWDFTAVAHTIRRLHRMNFISEDLVHHMVHQVLQNPEEVIRSRVQVLPLLIALGGCELQHLNQRQAVDVLVNHEQIRIKEENYFKRPWIKLAIELLSLDYHHTQLLELLTNQDFLQVYMSTKKVPVSEYKLLLRIHQALVTFGQNSLQIPEKYLQKARTFARERAPSKSDLKVRLHQILDSPDHLVSSVVTSNDIYIDHLLAIDEEGNTVIIEHKNSDAFGNISISSLQIPDNTKRIALMDIGSSHVFGPGYRLKGYIKLEQRILEAHGFQVVHIVQPELFCLPSDERSLHIKRQMAISGIAFC
nr:uncharacterized protein LOC113823559 isoform X1 [Penaeus vannamei]XP_027232024.1 uncharacterized protein LOC113823559 isoform X1 [Penaeus vannamei]XP_027232025.1 uncharacterized protein LOC113823559 isoform X1 [Penaeus vannamei]XP_027232026.1 uncharacterized protein LOC113823559 isoform X1 [Penaeus vannamei]